MTEPKIQLNLHPPCPQCGRTDCGFPSWGEHPFTEIYKYRKPDTSSISIPNNQGGDSK